MYFKDSKQLKCLRVINDENYFDGARWEALLSPTVLLHFQCRFNARPLTRKPLNDNLLPFHSDFWLKEKRWFVASDKHIFGEEFNGVEHLHVNILSIKNMCTICTRLQCHLLAVLFSSTSAQTRVSFSNWLRRQQRNFTLCTESNVFSI